MLLETWQRIYVSWTHLHQASPYFCDIVSYNVGKHNITVECQTIFNCAESEKAIFPEEGNIIMIKFGTKYKGGIKILGYLTKVKVKPFNPKSNSLNCCKNLKCTNEDQLQVLIMTFLGAYTSEDFDKQQPIRVQVLCNIKSTLKQNDALLFVDKSPLSRSILNPLDDGLLVVTLSARNPLKVSDNSSECVREIIKGILSPHPLPLLTIVKSLPSSDRLLVLPQLVERMKNTYRTKVLLCTRTSKALTDIGFNLENTDLKVVVVGKKCDIHQKLRKYHLDELATSEVNANAGKQLQEDVLLAELPKKEILLRAKRKLLNESDVVLSLVRNCHDDFMQQTFEDSECISHMCCIIDEANLCTEPEILIPLLYGISKLILIGDPDIPAKVCSKTASSFDYNKSLFHRAYDLDLSSE